MMELVIRFEEPSSHEDFHSKFYSNQIRVIYSPTCFTSSSTFGVTAFFSLPQCSRAEEGINEYTQVSGIPF